MRHLRFTMLFALLFVLVADVSMLQAQGQSGTTLTATVDVTGHWTKTFRWTIDKTVTPDTWNLFQGDQGTSQYTIVVTKDDGTEEAWVEGVITVTNGGAVATQDLAIVAVLQNGYGPPNDFLTSAPVDLSSNPVLDPGETGTYAYRVDIPITGGAFPQPHAGGTYKVTANVTITNHSGHLGEPFGPSPSSTTEFLSGPTLVNNTINVDDTNGGTWAFTDDGSVSYEKLFSCQQEGKNENTATIRETGQSDDASVTVNCYSLTVSKDAATSFKRTYAWTIDKSADQSALTLSTGQEFTVNYSVAVDATYTDSDWGVTGTITITNPAPMAATINSVTDVISPDVAASVSGATFPYTLAAGATLTLTYSAGLPDASSRTNTATATLQNYSYDYEMNATETGTTNFTGSAAVEFANATINHVDECIDVSDTYAGFLGTVCYADGVPKTFTYSRNIGPYDVCGDYTVDNTASFVTNEGGITGSDSWSVTVHVPCVGGCTLTPGYWKTHSKYGPAPYDDNWASLLPSGEDSPFFYSGQTYYQVLWTSPQGGNAYYILAHAYIAALLNFNNGADPSAAQAAFNAATALFSNSMNTPTYVGGLKGTKRQAWIDLAIVLDNYNNGLIGPGHCSEQSSTPTAAPSTSTAAVEGKAADQLFSEMDAAVPTTFDLKQNYPNPFNPSTTITFDLPQTSVVRLAVYSVTGQEVATLYAGSLNAGRYTFNWVVPSGLSSGTYIYRLQAGEIVISKKMALLR